VELNTLCEWGNGAQVCVIPSLKYANKTAIAEEIRKLLKLTCHPLVIKLCDHGLFRSMKMVPLVSVKTCRNQNEVWLKSDYPW
jgi:hypothetical protein